MFVADSVATVVRSLVSIGQTIVREQAGYFQLRFDTTIEFPSCKNIGRYFQMNFSSDLLDGEIVSIKALVIPTSLPT